MIDITVILELVTIIALVVIGMAFNKLRKNNDIQVAIEANDEVFKIAGIVVKAAQEKGITGELIELGMTKAEYALQAAKKELEARGITFDEERLINYIKANVLDMRVNIAGTDAEERKSE